MRVRGARADGGAARRAVVPAAEDDFFGDMELAG
jgi:hypothetical protein